MKLNQWLRRAWSHRRVTALILVALALLWFVFTNRQTARVHFPFDLVLEGPVGLLVLLSLGVGALLAVLALSLFRTKR